MEKKLHSILKKFSPEVFIDGRKKYTRDQITDEFIRLCESEGGVTEEGHLDLGKVSALAELPLA